MIPRSIEYHSGWFRDVCIHLTDVLIKRAMRICSDYWKCCINEFGEETHRNYMLESASNSVTSTSDILLSERIQSIVAVRFYRSGATPVIGAAFSQDTAAPTLASARHPREVSAHSTNEVLPKDGAGSFQPVTASALEPEEGVLY